MFLPVNSRRLCTPTSLLRCVRVCLSCDEHLKDKDKGCPSGRLQSNAQVSIKARKHQKLYSLATVCVLHGAREFSPGQVC